MNIYEPKGEDLSDDRKHELHKFFMELISLCNQYRITFSIHNIFFLHREVRDGKLLDVAGFSYNQEEKITYPVYVDRMSENTK